MQQQVATSVEQLHTLVDQLPRAMWDEAARYLTGLNTEDPVLRAFLLAPLDDEPETEEERLAVFRRVFIQLSERVQQFAVVTQRQPA